MKAPNDMNHDDEHVKDVRWEGWYPECKAWGLEVQPPFAEFLVAGRKVMDMRGYPIPTPLLGRRVLILESGGGNRGRGGLVDRVSGLADVVSGEEAVSDEVRIAGWCTFDRFIRYKNRVAFEAHEEMHLVSKDSAYAWKDSTTIMYGWVVAECGRFVDGSNGECGEGSNRPPRVEKMIRRMRSLFELVIEGG